MQTLSSKNAKDYVQQEEYPSENQRESLPVIGDTLNREQEGLNQEDEEHRMDVTMGGITKPNENIEVIEQSLEGAPEEKAKQKAEKIKKGPVSGRPLE